MKKQSFWALVILSIALFPIPLLHAQQLKDILPRTCIMWKGTITVERIGHGECTESKGKGDTIDNYKFKRNLEDVVTLEVCGVGPVLHVISITRTYEDNEASEKYVRDAQILCEDKSYPHRLGRSRMNKVQPGNSERIVKQGKTTLYTREGALPLEKGGTAKLTVWYDGRYQLFAGHAGYLDIRAETATTRRYACTGVEERDVSRLLTGKMGEGLNIDTQRYPWGSVTTTILPPGPIPYTLGMQYEGVAKRTPFRAKR